MYKKSLCTILSFLIFFISFPSTLFSQDKTAVAVLDLEGKGISALEAATLTDRLRSEMVSVGVFQVVERGQMEEILNEQGFQQTGCTSTECAVEIGKLLGVQAMCSGSIGKLGSVYTVDVRMFDVATGEISTVSSRDFEGGVEGLLGLIELVSKDLAGISVEGEEIAQEKNDGVDGPKKKKNRNGLLLLLLAGGGAGYAFSSGMLDSDDESNGELELPPGPPSN